MDYGVSRRFSRIGLVLVVGWRQFPALADTRNIPAPAYRTDSVDTPPEWQTFVRTTREKPPDAQRTRSAPNLTSSNNALINITAPEAFRRVNCTEIRDIQGVVSFPTGSSSSPTRNHTALIVRFADRSSVFPIKLSVATDAIQNSITPNRTVAIRVMSKSLETEVGILKWLVADWGLGNSKVFPSGELNSWNGFVPAWLWHDSSVCELAEELLGRYPPRRIILMRSHLMSTAKRKVSDFLLREEGLNTVKPKRST